MRPDLEWFLKNISVHYKIGICSAAEDEYVTAIAKNIIPKEVRLSLLWDRNWCEAVQLKDKIEVVFEKKLTKLSPLNFRMEEIILVEDSHHNASINSGNTIIIPPFRGESNDIYLKLLYDYLISVKEKVFINNGENHFL